jgi:hypothetical protein
VHTAWGRDAGQDELLYDHAALCGRTRLLEGSEQVYEAWGKCGDMHVLEKTRSDMLS